MITNDEELDTTLDRIRQFQAWIRQIRQVETNPTNYRSSVSGFLAELDRMQLEEQAEKLTLFKRTMAKHSGCCLAGLGASPGWVSKSKKPGASVLRLDSIPETLR